MLSSVRLLVAVAIAGVSCPALVRAVDIHVDAAVGSDANDGLTWATAMATVGAGLALAVALPGADVVRVAEGRYVGQVVIPPATSLLGGYASGGAARDALRRPTILDAVGLGTVVRFGAGATASLIEGFVVTGGRTSDPDEGGGITMYTSGGLVSQCIVERNEACRGGGIQAVGLPYIQIRESIIRDNVTRCGDENGDVAGVYLRGVCQGFPTLTLTDVAITGNRAMSGPPGSDPRMLAGGLRLRYTGGCYSSHVMIVGNSGTGLVLEETDLYCVNCAIANHPGWAVLRSCKVNGSLLGLLPGTLQGNDSGASSEIPFSYEPSFYGALRFELEHSVLSASQTFPTRVALDDACPSFFEDNCSVLTSLAAFPASGLCSGFTVGDPTFASGPGGTFYLSQVAAGQAGDSPAVDADPQPASDFGLDTRTTRTDHVPDAGAMDWGFHFPVSHPLWTATDFRVLRGALPASLPVHVTGVVSLPWSDAPGVLSDPSLPLLFYSVEWPLNRILVSKDGATDSVRLSF